MLKFGIIYLFLIGSVYSLTCYNGMKMLAMQSVGESTEECGPSAYCYNMSTTAYVMVNIVKAGCSTWRCMLAKDTCIFTTFQAVPVSLCCCSHDRCNVGGNPVYSDNPRQISGGNNNGGGGQYNGQGNGQGSNSAGYGGGSWGDASQSNNNGWGNNNDYNNKQTWSSQNAAKEETMSKQTINGQQMTEKQLQSLFNKAIDDKGDEIQLEGDFKKVDKNYKSTTSGKTTTTTMSARKDVEQTPIGSTTTNKKKDGGKDIEI